MLATQTQHCIRIMSPNKHSFNNKNKADFMVSPSAVWCNFFLRQIFYLLKYLFAHVMEQNLLVPLNWLAGAKLLQYSHLSTGKGRGKKQNNRVSLWTLHIY